MPFQEINTYVLNAHGGKTSTKLDLSLNQIVVTPASITTPYETIVNSGLEQSIHQRGELLDVDPTPPGWHSYGKGSNELTNIEFNTGNMFDTITTFAKYGQTQHTWSEINPDFKYNTSDWGYFESDSEATLVIKRQNGDVVHIKGQDIKRYLKEVKDSFQPISLNNPNQNLILKNSKSDNSLSAKVGDCPIFCCFPKIHKIKVFAKTDLKEVFDEIQKIHGENKVSVIVATCNASASEHNKKVSIKGSAKHTQLRDLIAPHLEQADKLTADQEPHEKTFAKQPVQKKSAGSLQEQLNKITSIMNAIPITIPPFDLGGGDKVNKINIQPDGSHRIEGENFNGQPRYITITPEGNILGHLGPKLGPVEMKMRSKIEDIFKYFNMTIPASISVPSILTTLTIKKH